MSDMATLIVDAGPLAGGWLTPGRVLRAVHRGARVASDAIGTLRPLDRGQVEVTLPAALAAAVVTPLPVRLDDALVTLRRPDDVDASFNASALGASITGASPTPGALSVALAGALGDGFGAEDVGLTLIAGDALTTELPPWSIQRLPDAVTAGEATLALGADGGKKKP